MKSAEIRQKFLEYFKQHGHEIVTSSSLVPGNDPTLLFTNAGMVQFKDVFLGDDPRNYTRATSSQRCVRAGGKHNDLENVGYTARHHTFFEMLGNFSFGDYFKREAIKFAWNFLTEELKLPKEKLWVTVYEKDQEAEDIWKKEMGIDPKQFSRCGEKDNFWSMGDTGPCGPCSEIFYDHGEAIAGGPPGSPEEDGDRYIEIWNLVFMQYNRDVSGELTELPKPSVDTGMGLERISAVMQDVHNNYDIDLFQHLIKFLAELADEKDLANKSLRVIADHIRSTAFLILDGVIPSNEGRGYVLRRIMRRALRYGHKLGLTDVFFYKLVQPLIDMMGEAYPDLTKQKANIEKIIKREEELFAATLDQGMKIYEQETKNLTGDTIPGEIVFKLYDTYGFPMDLTADIARERGQSIDETGFHAAMMQQRKRSQSASKFSAINSETVLIDANSEFTGYEFMQQEAAEVRSLIKDGQVVSSLTAGDKGIVVLDKTAFYAESGGQVGDKGLITNENDLYVEVHDVQKQKNAILHHVSISSGTLKLADEVTTKVDAQCRLHTAYNHSATHLLNAALREVLGEHVLQKGSLVEAERLRFDFSHFEALTKQELEQIESLVNEHIRINHTVQTEIMTPEEAMDKGAMALFGEKYGEEVRVLTMGEFSMELCGGTHVKQTGDIGYFKIISESGIAAGIRRIEAVTGPYAVNYITSLEAKLQQAADLLNTNTAELISKLELLQKSNKAREKEVDKLKHKLASTNSSDLLSQAQNINDITVLAVNLEGADAKSLRDTVDQIKSKCKQAVILLSTINEGKVSLVAGVTKSISKQVKAGELIQHVSSQIGGKGGGRPDMAQGGGTEPEHLPKALDSVKTWVEGKL